MSKIGKDAFQIISEATGGDDYNSDNISDDFDDDLEEDILGDYDDIEELDDDISYTAEMVNIFGTDKDTFLIEFDNLAKYMESSNIEDIKEAMEKVCKANEIPFEKSYLVLESKDTMSEILQESKAKLNKKAKKRVASKLKFSSMFLGNIFNKGIQVKRKKNKKKKK